MCIYISCGPPLMLRAFQPKPNREHSSQQHLPTWRAPEGSGVRPRSCTACLSSRNGCKAQEEAWLLGPGCQKEQVVKGSLSPCRPSPSSETFVEVVVHLPVGGWVDVHLKRYPDPILKALKRQGSNLTIKGKQWFLRRSLRLTTAQLTSGGTKKCLGWQEKVLH